MMRAAALAALLALLDGCSVIAIREPEPVWFQPTVAPACDSSPALPIFDAAVAVGAIVGAVVLARREGREAHGEDQAGFPGSLVLGASAIPFVASSGIGIARTRRCSKLIDAANHARESETARATAVAPPRT